MEDAEDVDGLAAALERFVSTNDSAAGRAARAVAEEHSWSRMAKEYVRLFETVATSHERGVGLALSTNGLGYSPA